MTITRACVQTAFPLNVISYCQGPSSEAQAQGSSNPEPNARRKVTSHVRRLLEEDNRLNFNQKLK